MSRERSEYLDMELSGLVPKTEFTIKSKDIKVVLNGRTFENVIIVERRYYRDNPENPFIAYHYYQRGVGEIYKFEPSPYSFRYADIGMLLLP